MAVLCKGPTAEDDESKYKSKHFHSQSSVCPLRNIFAL
jgi:hypothetical protein